MTTIFTENVSFVVAELSMIEEGYESLLSAYGLTHDDDDFLATASSRDTVDEVAMVKLYLIELVTRFCTLCWFHSVSVSCLMSALIITKFV